jgi:hypothetical protein
MRALKLPVLSYRAQAIIIVAVVAFWHWDMWVCRHYGDRAPVITIALFFALPIFTTVLSYLIVDTRMRSNKRADIWFYVGLVSGLVPWVSMVI